jgi:hypothetical protein
MARLASFAARSSNLQIVALRCHAFSAAFSNHHGLSIATIADDIN